MIATIARQLQEIDFVLNNKALTGDNFDDYYVQTKAGREVDPVDVIVKKLKTHKDKNLKFLFTGYSSAGKSTELFQLQKKVENDFLIKTFSAREILYPNTTFLEFIIYLTIELFDFTKNNFYERIEIDTGEFSTYRRLNNLINSTQQEEIYVDSEVDKTHGLFWTEPEGTRKTTKERKIVKKEMSKSLVELVELCNLALNEIKTQLDEINKENILLIIDDFEKIPIEKIDEFFTNFSQHLYALSCHLVFTFPRDLYFSPGYRSIRGEFNRHYFLPMIKILNKDGSEYKPGINCMMDIVYKRLDTQLISENLLKRFIRMSGGVLKDLFQLLRQAADSALERGDSEIREEDFFYSFNRLKNDYFNTISYNKETGLSPNDYYDLLVHCYKSIGQTLIDVKGMEDLKQNNLILPYGVEPWYDVHPVVKEILKDNKYIDDKDWAHIVKKAMTYNGPLMMPEEEKESRYYPPISLKSLTLHNIKCFQDAKFSFTSQNQPRPWSLLVGDNGVGKTTILHCICLCSLGPELASKIIPMPQYMLRMGAEEGYMEAVFYAPLQSGPAADSTDEVTVRLNIKKGSRTFEIHMEGDKPSVNRLKKFIEARKRTDFDGWFVAGYGAVRNLLFTDEPFKIARQDPVIDRVESLFDPTKLLIDPASLNRFLAGDSSPFKEMGAPLKLPTETINHIRELLDQLLPMISLKDPNGTGNLETPFGKVPISELSEGYKSMLSWLAHLIMHLLAAVKWRGNISDIQGIVLIDEVDLHLHPAWQQQVIPSLQTCFPNLQFIGCTHSPMTAGGANDGDIILLDYHEGKIDIRQDLPSIKGWRADQILTGPLFGLESTRDLSTQQKLEQYTQLLESSKLSHEQEKKLQELEKELGNLIPSAGETETQREAFRMIEETMQSYLEKQTPAKKRKLLDEIKRQLKH